MPITFGDREFGTQKAAEAYVRDLLEGVGICDSVKLADETTYTRLCEVLKNHPASDEKLDGMVDLKIIRNRLNSKAKEIHVVNCNGDCVDISWRICITRKSKTSAQEVISSMRSSIVDQILMFRRNSDTLKCNLCGVSSVEMHVDHVIPFEKLAKDFLENVNNVYPLPSKFGDAADGSNRIVFLPEDNAFEDAWSVYHKNQAILRTLCWSCNLRRKRKENNV